MRPDSGVQGIPPARPPLAKEVNMNVSLSLGHGHHDHRHTRSDVLITFVAIGLVFTVFSIVMMQTGSSESPWHMLAIVVGIPSALAASIFCLVRAWETTQ